MNSARCRTVGWMLVAALLLTPTAIVAAKELGALTISGPGIKGELRVDGTQEMARLDGAGFFDLSRKVEAPQGLGEGYTIVRYLNMEDGLVAWDKIVYYPDPAGGSDYIYYAGGIDKNNQGYSTGWYRARTGSAQVFQSVLAAHGVTIAVGAPAPQAAPAESVAQPPIGAKAETAVQPQVEAGSPDVMPALGIGLVAVLVAGLAIARGLSAQRRRSAEPVPANK